MPLNIPWNGITWNGILVGFLLAAMVGFLASRILQKARVMFPVVSFKPQRASQQARKSAFQGFWGCLTGIATALVVIGLVAWMIGALGRFLPFLPRLSDILGLANGRLTGLVLVGCIVLLVALGIKGSTKRE